MIPGSARPHTYLVQPAARADSLKELCARSALRISAAAGKEIFGWHCKWMLILFRLRSDSQPEPEFSGFFVHIHTYLVQPKTGADRRIKLSCAPPALHGGAGARRRGGARPPQCKQTISGSTSASQPAGYEKSQCMPGSPPRAAARSRQACRQIPVHARRARRPPGAARPATPAEMVAAAPSALSCSRESRTRRAAFLVITHYWGQ